MDIAPSQSHAPFSLLSQQQQALQRESPRSPKGPLIESREEQAEIEKLRKRDQEVRSHEQAHIAAAGGLAKGGATFSVQRGPDGKEYAVGGEVKIDTSPIAGNPKATIRKAQQIRAAALAPADPSAQDRAVAASANGLEVQAQQELQKKEQGGSPSDEETPTSSSYPRIDLFV
ncbi:MAG: putative metalloprotease CJM1_0395 family protein [Nitrospirota bacterium]|nr:putative metalloprotease CJM1_0395 family protein [Nitrospirota bacterium]